MKIILTVGNIAIVIAALVIISYILSNEITRERMFLLALNLVLIAANVWMLYARRNW